MLLLTGPTGNTGREVAQRLRAAGIPFRGMARRVEAREELERLGFEAVHGDFDDPGSLESALQGATRAYLVCTPDAMLPEREGNFIDAAKAAGVGHIVKLSGLLASSDAASPMLRFHAQVEDKLERSGIAFTTIRPHGFMQTMYFMSEALIRERGIMTYPGGDASAAWVDLRDVADAVFKVLTTDGHGGKTYDVTGGAAISFTEMAEVLSRALGQRITYVPAREDDMRGAMAALGVAAAAVDHVIEVFRLVRDGKLAFTTGRLRSLGIVPRDWERFAADLSAHQTQGATSFKVPEPEADGG